MIPFHWIAVTLSAQRRFSRRVGWRWIAPWMRRAARRFTSAKGGRPLEQVVSHVAEVESSYAGATGVKLGAGLDFAVAREAIVSGLRAVVSGEI